MISLPKPLTSFIGRERELAQARRLLQGSYLVTLTGPGGSGKTRLCIALAAEVAADYPDGVYFVPLAPVRDPGLVASTIAQSIGLQDARDRPLMEHLVSQLRERKLLIVLDNFEHLLAGAPVVTRLLQETDAGLPVLDGLAELVDQSLLRQVRVPGLPPGRYAMLETIREYAAERLDAMPEADRARRAHAGAFLALVEADGRPHAGLAKKEWLERVDLEHNNIRAALSWYLGHDPPAALRLAASMAAFWSLRGHHTEGRQRLGELLGLVPDPSLARVSALNGAAWLAIDQGDYDHAAGLLAESIGLSRTLGDTVGEGIATVYLGRSKMSRGRITEGAPDVARAVALVSEAGDRPAIAFAIFYSGLVAQLTGQLEDACDIMVRCAAMAAELGLAPLNARAHSRVRSALGLTFTGHPYPQDWLLADALLDWDPGQDAAHAFFRPDGLPMILFPMRGHRWRLTFPFAGRRSGQAPTLEEIQQLTDQRAPRPVTVSDPTWLANFRCHRRSASAYRRGRVLLAGDGAVALPDRPRGRHQRPRGRIQAGLAPGCQTVRHVLSGQR
jgi:AAA domain-containing protein/FAD binding domain-containing protein